MLTELDLADDAISILRMHGEASLLYITAEFSPFSNQKRPDIYFSPNRGQLSTESYVTEFKITPAEGLLPYQLESIVEHQSFVRESTNLPGCHFSFATDAALSGEASSYLTSKGVHVIGKVRNGQDLALEIMAWANVGNIVR